jgi:hypothetical protein
MMSTNSLRRRSVFLLAWMMIFTLAGCARLLDKNQPAGQPVAPSVLPATLTITTAPTEQPATLTITTAPTGQPASLAQTGMLYCVVGLAPGDSLALYGEPGGAAKPVGALPASACGLTASAESQDVEGKAWMPVVYKDQAGWVERAFLAEQAGSAPTGLPEAAQQAIWALKTENYLGLAALVDEQLGLRFSPYSYVRPEDQHFNQDEVDFLPALSRTFLWGSYDGSGEPIDLPVHAYRERFIYDVDFAQPQVIGFNTVIGQGNTLNNWEEFYPGAAMVEFHFRGFDPQYDGMDWRSLRLVFTPSGSAWKLIGIIHDQWTI